MKLIEHPAPLGKQLIIEATNENEHSILQDFAKLNEPLTARIEHDSHYLHPYLTIRKGKLWT